MSGCQVLSIYTKIAQRLPQPVGREVATKRLEKLLPDLWEQQYQSMALSTPELVLVTFGERQASNDPFITTMFDLASGGGETDPRVVAVWGTSKTEPASSRDKSRMKGFLSTPKRLWSNAFPGRDRGHFFAHSMGGGVDINLFPQLSRVNQGNAWRDLEKEAAASPGTFCFIQPIYSDGSWIPKKLVYGLFNRLTFVFKGGVFEN